MPCNPLTPQVDKKHHLGPQNDLRCLGPEKLKKIAKNKENHCNSEQHMDGRQHPPGSIYGLWLYLIRNLVPESLNNYGQKYPLDLVCQSKTIFNNNPQRITTYLKKIHMTSSNKKGTFVGTKFVYLENLSTITNISLYPWVNENYVLNFIEILSHGISTTRKGWSFT